LTVSSIGNPADKSRKNKLEFLINGLVYGKIYRKTPYLMVKTMVSCKISKENQSIDLNQSVDFSRIFGCFFGGPNNSAQMMGSWWF